MVSQSIKTQNSSFMCSSKFDTVKGIINETIHKNFDISSVKAAMRIVDLGCSVGPNTFYAIQTIIDAMLAKLRQSPIHQAQAFEVQVFFNDQTANDFNMLFSTAPPDRRYFMAGVPGSFHSRLLPRDSIHFFNSTMAMHWLSRSPAGVTNKGRMQIYGGGPTVLGAYMAQFRADVEAFLSCRAEELVDGGLMTLLFMCRIEGMDLTATKMEWLVTYLEPIFRDFVLEGKIKEEELDSFQAPTYAPSIKEFKELVEMDGRYTIHVAEIVDQGWGMKGSGEDGSDLDLERLSKSISVSNKAIFEELLKSHFGEKVVAEVFQGLPARIHRHLVTCHPLPPPPPAAFFILQRNPRV